ncbi:MAG: restriction endonuclease subunit S, partial [Oscillospiraceae bacterium]|nr:restriction endonuclease subunit S [Oscillospiraceae bacterium]
MGIWQEYQLGDLITFQRGHDLPKAKMKCGKYPVVGSNGIIGFHNEYTTESPSITIGRSGNVGKPFLYKGRSWSHNTSLYIKEYKNVDPIFIYYYLQTLDLGNYAGGSAVPTLNRNHIHTLSVYVPIDIEEQQKIASVLSALDDKIGLNNRINENLEKQAQAIFKSWFVDFEPFGGNIPNNWEQGNL